jgi:hypothetical protein
LALEVGCNHFTQAPLSPSTAPQGQPGRLNLTARSAQRATRSNKGHYPLFLVAAAAESHPQIAVEIATVPSDEKTSHRLRASASGNGQRALVCNFFPYYQLSLSLSARRPSGTSTRLAAQPRLDQTHTGAQWFRRSAAPRRCRSSRGAPWNPHARLQAPLC